MTVPTMSPWNLGLRVLIELAALAGLVAAGTAIDGWGRWPASVALPLVAAAAWGTFNVLDDPSRSGRAPVEVSGRTRLAIEALVLGSGVTGWLVAGLPAVALALAATLAMHLAFSTKRLAWLARA
jgi:hypothetical protein